MNFCASEACSWLTPSSGFISTDVFCLLQGFDAQQAIEDTAFMFLMFIVFCLNLVLRWSNLFFLVLCSISLYTHTVYLYGFSMLCYSEHNHTCLPEQICLFLLRLGKQSG